LVGFGKLARLNHGPAGKAFASEVHFVHQAADGALLVIAAPNYFTHSCVSLFRLFANFCNQWFQVFGILIEVVSPTSADYLDSPLLPVFSLFSGLKGEEKVHQTFSFCCYLS
jgi:hypothetical protein